MQPLCGCICAPVIAGCARVDGHVFVADLLWPYCGGVELILVAVDGDVDASAWSIVDGGAALGVWIA